MVAKAAQWEPGYCAVPAWGFHSHCSFFIVFNLHTQCWFGHRLCRLSLWHFRRNLFLPTLVSPLPPPLVPFHPITSFPLLSQVPYCLHPSIKEQWQQPRPHQKTPGLKPSCIWPMNLRFFSWIKTSTLKPRILFTNIFSPLPSFSNVWPINTPGYNRVLMRLGSGVQIPRGWNSKLPSHSHRLWPGP